LQLREVLVALALAQPQEMWRLLFCHLLLALRKNTAALIRQLLNLLQDAAKVA